LQLYAAELIAIIIVVMVMMTVRSVYMAVGDFFFGGLAYFNHIQGKP
jgi:hypothetical protein